MRRAWRLLGLGELRPGLLDGGIAASLIAEEFASDEVSAWLVDPTLALLPRKDWPKEVPRAKVQVQSQEDWEEIAGHLVKLGSLGVIAKD